MPGYDRSGPMGQGPKTGRGMGLCGGARADAGWENRGFGLGRGGRPWGGGRGRCMGGWFGGRGRGFGGGAYRGGYPVGAGQGGAYPSDTEALLAEAENLKQRLQDVENRLAGMARNDSAE